MLTLLLLLLLLLVGSATSFRVHFFPGQHSLRYRWRLSLPSSPDESLHSSRADNNDDCVAPLIDSAAKVQEVLLSLRTKDPPVARVVERATRERDVALAELEAAQRELMAFEEQREAALHRKNIRLELSDALRKRQLSLFTQRYLLERLFEKVVAACREPQTRHTLASISALPAHLLDALCFDAPSAKTVYQLLCVGAAREVLWERVGLSQTCALPCFAEESLCGGLRTLPRSPADDKAFVSELALREKKAFFAEIGRLFAVQVEEFRDARFTK